MTGIERAILRAGGASKLANTLGVSRQVVSHWRKTGRVPPAHITKVAEATKMPVSLFFKDWH